MSVLTGEAEPAARLAGEGFPVADPHGRGLSAALVGTAVTVGLTAPAWGINHDLPGDTAAVADWAVRPLAVVAWPVVTLLLATCVLHYLAAAGAARAAAGVRLPLAELFAVQFTASAANRLTPAGVGGATVNGRFFHRRGLLSPGGAAAAVSALAALGAIADVIGFAAVLGVGSATGLPGVRGELPLLIRKLTGLVPAPTYVWWFVPAAVVTIAPAVCARPVRRAVHNVLTRSLRGYGTAVGLLLRRPTRVTALMSCSAASTLMLAAGFAAAATSSHLGIALTDFGAVMIGYMAASAASNALPTPGGIGTADAALVGVLTASGSTLAHAVPVVLAFRLITFWLPALLGLGLARPLHRRGVL